jgi:hypothetical protein
VSVLLSDAIAQLRDELRKAVLERDDQDIVFVPTEIELELGVTLEAEAKAGGGFKLLVFVDLSTEARASRSSAHTVKMRLQVFDRDLKPIKVVSTGNTVR